MQLQQLMADLDEQKRLFDASTNNFGLGNESIDVKSFIAHLTSLTQKSRNVISMLTNNDKYDEDADKVVATVATQYNLSPKTKKVNWIIMGEKIGFKAVGQSGFTMDVLDLMAEHMDEVETCRNAVVVTNRELGKYLLNLDLLNKFSPSKATSIESAKKFTKEFAKLWQGTEGLDRDTLDSLYKSYRQFDACSEKIHRLTVKFDTASVKTLQDDMRCLDDTLDRLLDAIQSGTTVNTSSARKLGDLIYNLAEWVSVSALYITKTVAINQAHLDNVERINEIVD